ncbi:MAG: hypothetical protein HY898_06990 [Deltaproteobacteria bacterium]|nr:hypothetical protein [Deltaproteobacteria bacterium]
MNLGRYNDANKDLTLTDNYLVGATEFPNPWQTMTISGNTFIGPVTGAIDTSQYPGNVYLADKPTGTKVFVRANREQAGRAHVIVYNWDGADQVEVDLAAVLKSGDGFEVRNGQSFLAPAAAKGTFEGAPVSLPGPWPHGKSFAV